MSLAKFQAVLDAGTYSRDERTWFPKMHSRFREFLLGRELLPGDVDRAVVILFLQQIKANGTPAWQRLQAVRAIGTDRSLVLKSEQPSLQFLNSKLSELAARECDTFGATAQAAPGSADERHLIRQTGPAAPLQHKRLHFWNMKRAN